ncbi:MAG: hypothetical protein JWR55_587 [Aeromicrobium sp.]|nr:hypothetical protein [Aeromicrobium sp.]
MTLAYPDPTEQWPEHLERLDDDRRRVVAGALRRSAAEGWPASQDAVELLVAYALGEISSRQYAMGILRSWNIVRPEPAPPPPLPSEPSEPPHQPEPSESPVRISREEAVQAYVTGRIDVAEFLRLARR